MRSHTLRVTEFIAGVIKKKKLKKTDNVKVG
jgi:hypothetical protein